MSQKINRVMTPLEWGLLLALSVLWGGSFFFAAVALAELPPLTIVIGRTAIAGLALFAAMHIMGLKMPRDAAVWAMFLGMGLLNNVMPFSLIVWAQTQITSGLASILNAATPLTTVLVAHVLTHDERMTPNRIAGVLVGLAGVAWMIGGDAMSGAGSGILAQIAVLAAGLSYSLAGIYGRGFARRAIPPVVTAAGQCIASTAILLPLVLLIDRPWTLALPGPQTLAAVAALGLVSTALGYAIFFRILATAGATNIMLVTFLIPVSAVLLDALVLGERLEARQFVGMLTIGAGLALIDGRVLKYGFRDCNT